DHAVPGEVLRVHQHGQRIGGGHLLLQPVHARLDLRGVLGGGEQRDERRGGLDDALLDEGRGDVRAGVAFADLDEHLPAAGSLELGRLVLDADVRGDPPVPLEAADGEGADHGEDEQHGQQRAEESAASAARLAAVPSAAGKRSARPAVLGVLRLGEVVEGVVFVLHQLSSSVGSCEVALGGSSTSSPPRRPVDLSRSRACWRIITAATWSTTRRWRRPLRPELCSALCADTVVSRSSIRRTSVCREAATSSVTSSAANTRAFVAAAPSVPSRDLGSPTMMTWASSSRASWTTRRAAVSRSRVSTGVAMSPSRSLRASPTRTSPTSTPSLTPRGRPVGASA